MSSLANYLEPILSSTRTIMPDNPELFLVKGAEALPDNVIIVTAEVREEPTPSASDGPDRDSEDRVVHKENIDRIDHEDDGFRTPELSVDRKIAAADKCPPPPKKPKPAVPSRKRKHCDRNQYGRGDNDDMIFVHLSDQEVEAMFPEIIPSELSCNKIKKARRGDVDRSP